MYDLPTKIPGAVIHITSNQKSESAIVLTGYVQDKSSKKQLSRKHQYTYDPFTIQQEDALRQLANRIERAYGKKIGDPSKKNADTASPGLFTIAYRSLRDQGLRNDNWNDSTAEGTFTYFEKNILKPLDQLGTDVTLEDVQAIKKQLIQKAVENKRGSRSPDVATKSVCQYLFRCNWILHQMAELDLTLPRVTFDSNYSAEIPMTEQFKFVPNEVRVPFAYALTQLADNGLSLGASAMFLMGARTAEACAIKIGELTLRDGWYVDCPILFQMRNGKRVPRLKTNAAYRHAVGGYLMYRLIDARCTYLRQLGFTEAEILEMPLVSHPKDCTQYADPSDLSAYAKNLLLTCGLTQEQLLKATVLMTREPDLDEEGKPETDISAYILRRDWVGRAANVCGMSSVDIDYLIGHKNPAVSGKDYTNPDIQEQLARQLERYVCLPDYSKHPYFAPISAQPRKPADLNGYGAYRICADKEPVLVTLDITTCECGEDVRILTDGIAITPPTVKYAPKDTPALRLNRPLIGRILSQEQCYALKEAGMTLDLASFHAKEEST